MDGRSIVFERAGQPLTIQQQDVPDPKPGEAIARVTLAGVCGTDAHRLRGDLAAPPAPVNFGHEAVGVIVRVGEGGLSDARGDALAEGDRVYWLPAKPCGQCQTCLDDKHPVICERVQWPSPADSANAAGYRELALLDSRNIIVRIPEGTSDDALIAFGCAMPTALAAIGRLLTIPSTLVVQGSGPVGLATVVAAKRAGVEKVIVIGDPQARLDKARELGADAVIPLTGTSREERLVKVMSLTGNRGVGAVIEAAGHKSAIDEGLDLLGNNGQYVVVGIYSGDGVVPVDFVRVNNKRLTISGSLDAQPETYIDAVAVATDLGEKLHFADLIEQRFPLEQTEQAIAAAAAGAIKVVVEP